MNTKPPKVPGMKQYYAVVEQERCNRMCTKKAQKGHKCGGYASHHIGEVKNTCGIIKLNVQPKNITDKSMLA